MAIIRMNYEVVEQTRHTLVNGSQEMQDRLNQLARDMEGLGDSQGAWIKAFTEMKMQWDRRMVKLVEVLNRTSEQLKQSAIKTQEADAASAAAFNRISV